MYNLHIFHSIFSPVEEVLTLIFNNSQPFFFLLILMIVIHLNCEVYKPEFFQEKHGQIGMSKGSSDAH